MITVLFLLFMKNLDLGNAKMSSFQQFSNVALESSDINGGGGGLHGCGGGAGGATPSCNGIEIENVKDKDGRRKSNVSDCSVEILDLESGVDESKLHLARNVKDCRICHLSMDATNQDSEMPIELGCSCKADLAAAHKQCAESWFKIKGNKICEICGSMAQNVAGANEAESMEQWNETNAAAAADATATTHAPLVESRNFWQGHRFLNFLLACMVFAFVISWLFHFNVPS